MTGNIQVKDGKYYLILNLHENGKRKQKWISTNLDVKGNKRNAEKLLRETLAKYEAESGHPKSDLAFSEYVKVWLKYISKQVDIVTFQGYELLAKAHIIPYFEVRGTRLCDISCDVLQEYVDTKLESGRRDGKGGLSPNSLKHHMNILRQTLAYARRKKLIDGNPSEFVIIPKVERFEAKFYTKSEIKALFDAIDGDELHDLIIIATLYGLRRSEVLGLQWDSIDFENNRVTIKHVISVVTKTIAKDKTKNASSYRSFAMSEKEKDMFRSLKEKEEENRRLFGKEYQNNNYIFKWANGVPYSPNYVSGHFSWLLKKNNLPKIRFHELRHSCASMLIAAGYHIKDIQDFMGHSNIYTTANVYGHLDTSRKNDMVNDISGTLL